MRALHYIKTTLKQMASTWIITIFSFVLLPIIIAMFMGYFQNIAHDNSLKVKELKVKIVDKDNSEMSKQLIDTLKSDEMKEISNIVDKKPEVELLIEKGYGEKVLSLNKGEIFINKKVKEREFTIDTFKIMLDKYHQGVYVTLSGGNLDSLSKFDTSELIENEMIDTLKTNNAYEKVSASMVGLVIMLLIVSIIKSGYNEISTNLDKRMFSTPITKLQLLFYDSAAMLVYCFIIILSYVIFFRFANLSFKGNIIDLLILVFIATILVVSISKTISTLFPAKYGNVIGIIVYALPLISGEMFTGEGNKIAFITPTHYLSNAFSMYNLNGNLGGCGKVLLIILGVSVGIYLLAIIKQGVNWRKKVCA